jgi:hypothetical protein
MSWWKELAEPELSAALAALRGLVKKLEQQPEENWRASLAYENAVDTLSHLAEWTYYVYEDRPKEKPPDYQHWRDKHKEALWG